MDRAQLEQMALEKISKMQTVPSSNIDRQQLEQMALEKMSQMGTTPINKDQEASLGFGTRAQYAIEPIQSNRKALLQQKYGTDNVLEQDGELFINQNGQFLPVNKDGVSVADFADFAGATPEMVGGVVGTVAGVIGGGGVASVPAAIALGAAGGATGSAARQGLSSFIGTPQVATSGERVAETALSGAFGGVGSAIGLGAKAVAPKVKAGISSIIKSLPGRGEIVENTAKTVGKSEINLAAELVPEYAPKTVDSIMGKVSDQSQREAVQTEMKKLNEIALRQNLPAPTYAQAAQGKAIIAESEVLDTPLISGKVRKTVDTQLKNIQSNLEKITGKFIDVDSTAYDVGIATREYAESSVESVKKLASELYQKVEDEGADAMIGKSTFLNKFKDKAGELGLINPDLTRSQYAADSSFTPDTFKTLQDTVFGGLDAIRKNPSAKIRFESANALRKFIKNSAEEQRDKNPNAARLLEKFGRELDGTIEGILNREAPKLGEKFKEANRNWAKYKTQDETLSKYLKADIGDENVAKAIMSNSFKVKAIKEIIGEGNMREVGKTYVKDILSNLGKSGIGRADTAMTAIKKNRAQLVEALGDSTYQDLVENLHFLNRTGQPLSVSRQSLLKLFSQPDSIKSIGAKVFGAAKNYSESKGQSLSKSVKDSVVETTGKIVPTTSKGASAAANLFGDNNQRSWSSFPAYGNGNVTENEKAKRQRAISGSK